VETNNNNIANKLEIKNILYTTLLVILFFSCKKKDDNPPVINITYPIDNNSFSTIDSILVKGKITDDKKIVSYSFSIVDAQMKIVCETETYNGENNKSINLNNDFFFSNIYLPTGQYYLLVSASDGTNTTNNYTKITLQAINTELKKVIVSLDNNQTTDIYKIDSGQVKFLFSSLVEYQDVDVNSDYQQIMILSKNGSLKSYDANSYNITWEKSNLNNYYTNYFARIKNFRKTTYVGYNFGNIKAINKYGTITNTYDANNDAFLPSDICEFNNEIFTYFFTKNTLSGEVAYFYETGNFHNYYALNLDQIIGIFAYDETKILILGNIGDSAKAYTLNPENNYLDNEDNFISAKILSAFKDDANNIYFATTDKIQRYSINNKAIYSFINNINNALLFYDKLNQIIYVASGNQIKLYNKNGILITSYTFISTVIDIDFLYNKSLDL